MRFVLVAGFLTQSYPIPNPNPQTTANVHINPQRWGEMGGKEELESTGRAVESDR